MSVEKLKNTFINKAEECLYQQTETWDDSGIATSIKRSGVVPGKEAVFVDSKRCLIYVEPGTYKLGESVVLRKCNEIRSVGDLIGKAVGFEPVSYWAQPSNEEHRERKFKLHRVLD